MSITFLSRSKYFSPSFGSRTWRADLGSNLTVADELEEKLAVVNQPHALRQYAPGRYVSTTEAGQGMNVEEMRGRRAKKNRMEREKRERERQPLERLSRLFKAPPGPRLWTRNEVLSQSEIVSLLVDAAAAKR